MNRINWTAVAVFAIVALLVFLVGASLLGGRGYSGWGMMGPGMMGQWGFGSFGWFGMIFMWLIPIGFILLIVLGIAWLVRAIGGGGNPGSPARACPNCGHAVQADWRNCPYCGETLTSA
jgi:hypothetical protein